MSSADITFPEGPFEEFYLTFGQRWRTEQHPTYDRATPDGWVTIVARDFEEAREGGFLRFGENFAMIYAKADFQPDEFPLGELSILREVVLPGEHLAWMFEADLIGLGKHFMRIAAEAIISTEPEETP